MITRVLDDTGEVVHDCLAEGCEVSWDGYRIADDTPVEGRADPAQPLRQLDARTVKLERPPAQG